MPKVRPRDQPRALPTSTKGIQWVGIAACRNATVNPVRAMEIKAVSFMSRAETPNKEPT